MNITAEQYRDMLAKNPTLGRGKKAKKSRPTSIPKPKTKGTKADYKAKMWNVMNSICDGWTTEYKFHPKRKWRADWCNEKLGVLVEYEGIFGGFSRHTNNIGYSNDACKYNQAQLLGWKVLRYTALNYEELGDDLRSLIKK